MISRKSLLTLAAFSATVLSLALQGCGGSNEKKEGADSGKQATPAPQSATGGEKKRIGVSLSSRNHNFFLGMEQGVRDELAAQGLEGEFVVAEDSASKQQEQIDLLLRKGVAAIIMVPVDAKQAVTAIEAANKKNVPIFCIDRRVTDPAAKVTATIETDNVAMGEEAGKYALKLLCDRKKLDAAKPEDLKKLQAKIVHLWGLEAASSAQDRATGFEKVFNATATPGVQIIKQVGNFNAKTSQEVMAPTLAKDADIELVYCHNDDNAIGTLNAILDVKKGRGAANDPKRIFIVSIDGNKPAIEAIRKGDIEVTISQQPIQMGQETVRQVKKVLDGGKPDKEYLPISHQIITQKDANDNKGKLWADQLRDAK